MTTVREALTLALQHFQAGDLQRAETLYRQILQADAQQAEAWHFLGAIAHQTGKHEVAVQSIRQAIALAPQQAGLHYNLGSAYQALGQSKAAEASFREALRLEPRFADAHNNLGNALADQGLAEEAAACYRRALGLNPRFIAAHYNLGNCLRKQGKLNEALGCYSQALRLQPDDFAVHLNLGSLLLEQNEPQQALTHYQAALKLNPRNALVHNNAGNALQALGRLDEAAASYRQALRLAADFGEAYYNLGHVYVEQRKWDEAGDCYRQALRLKPDLAGAHASLANVLSEQGKVDEAAASMEHALRLEPTPRFRLAWATRLPVVCQSPAELESWRQRLVGEVGKLHDQHVVYDLTEEPAQNLFYLAYHGRNDRDIQRRVARLQRAPQPPLHSQEARPGLGQRKIRVGLLSSFFRSHTIGYWFRGLVAQLSRDAFTVTVLSVGNHRDDIASFFQERADHYLVVPKHLPSARRLIVDQQLDVLLYADVGMGLIPTTLAFSRLAPVQCATVGHPVTTGIDTIDYFISSEPLETAESDQCYTETLIRLKVLPIYYYRPQIPHPLKPRDFFGLACAEHVYACPQTLFKFHPDFDDLLGGILRGDPRGVLVLCRGVVPHWEKLLRQRFAATLPDVVDRIRFLPRLSYADYLNLLGVSDVQLDTLHFGGGNTSYDGFTVGLPIVTLPTRLLRGRITLSLYKQMNVLDCVASTPQEYIDMALRLGADPDYRQTIRDKIRAAAGVLFENSAGIRELEAFFQRAVQAASLGLPPSSLLVGPQQPEPGL